MGAARRLFIASGLILFLELCLIRWSGANVVHLSYFTNFILLGSFLGIGLGFLTIRWTFSMLTLSTYLLAGYVALILVAPVQIVRDFSELIFFTAIDGRLTGLPAWLMLPLIFVFVTAIFMTLAQTMGRAFAQLPALAAYRIDILGSLTGIVVFSGLSFLGWPPLTWGILVAAGYLCLQERGQWRKMVVPLGAIVILLGLESLPANIRWSPYYKVDFRRQLLAGGLGEATVVQVNGIPHQSALSVAAVEQAQLVYLWPYERYGPQPPSRVLVIGAGTGTDVATALAKGANRVEAVEIDPVLAKLGRQRHPDRPYDDPRVQLWLTDGRAFLEQTAAVYDLIVFALPDSLTLVAGQSSLRLESYMFTREAIRATAKKLAPEGVFVMYNYYRRPWLIDRLATTLQEVFGVRPCVERVTGETDVMLSVALRPNRITCPNQDQRNAVPPVTDDYPFLYLGQRSIPTFYLLTLLLIVAFSGLAVRRVLGPLRQLRPYADLFWMGAAFLLLETKNVVQFALLFGTTWIVNALVFAGILGVVFLAVTMARHLIIRRLEWWYGALLASLLVAWLVPPGWLLRLSAGPRFLAATVLAFAPVFIANCIFASRLRAAASSTAALAANLLGAMVGGVLEYTSLVVGYRYLLVLIAACYVAALWLMPRPGRHQDRIAFGATDAVE